MSESPKVLVTATKHYYPDLVICAPDEDGKESAVRYPLLVAEVLSPSTEQHDKGTKLFAYQQVPGIEVILLIATDEQCVTVYQRASEHPNQWISQQYRPDAGETSFSILGASLAVADLYRFTGLAVEYPEGSGQ